MPVTGTATTPMNAGISSGTCQSHRSVMREKIARTAENAATTTHARPVSEALSAAHSLPLANSRVASTPASAAACTTTMTNAAASHTTESRSTAR